MSQIRIVTRKSATTDEKEKTRTDSPVRDMKKKVAANTEKEKLAAEKLNGDKCMDKKDKDAEKPVTDEAVDKKAPENITDDAVVKEAPEKQNGDKPAELKIIEKQNAEKTTVKASKSTEKPADKKAEEANSEDSSKGEKSGKPEPKETPNKTDKKDTEKPKQNGPKPHNGVSDVTLSSNGGTEEVLSTVSEDSDEETMMVIDDHENDELFPELLYDDDSSDVEYIEPQTPESLSRSLTRRSQVKSARTPDTPRPASEKNAQSGSSNKDDKQDNSVETIVFKLNEDSSSSPRKLRSTDSPKKVTDKVQESKVTDSPTKSGNKREISQKDEKKTEGNNENFDVILLEDCETTPDGCCSSPRKLRSTDSPKKGTDKVQESKVTDSPTKSGNKTEISIKDEKKTEGNNENFDVILVVDCETTPGEARKPDTNFSKSRVKVSPYRRSMRLADQTTSSVMANYTGNNTTMEMDISESSLVDVPSPSEEFGSYISTIRNMRGRRSYKHIEEMNMRNIERGKMEAAPKLAALDQASLRTSVVVGRKRKPEVDSTEFGMNLNESRHIMGRKRKPEVDVIEFGVEVTERHRMNTDGAVPAATEGKRMRLLDKFTSPFRRVASSTPLPQRRAAPIVGINTDLPMSVPVASAEPSHPELLMNVPVAASTSESLPALYVPLPDDKDRKRCVVM